MQIAAIVPARGGSRGIPYKNTKDLAGKPLFQWSVQAGLECDLVDRVVVTTNSRKVASKVNYISGADLRFTGPNLHRDNGLSLHAELDVMEYLWREHQVQPEALLRLQPTSPFRNSEHIREAYDSWSKRGAIVGVEPAPKHPNLLTKLDRSGTLEMLAGNEERQRPRQQYDPVYAVNGALYLARVDYWRDHHGFFGPKTEGYVMDQIPSWDIDTPADWKIAEKLAETELQGRTRRCIR